MTQEEVAQVIAYCEENKVSYKQRLDELGIAAWMFYDAKRKYAPKQEADNAGDFLQLVPGGVLLNIERGQWHSLKSLESGTVLLECKDGAYRPLGEDEVMVK